MVPHLCPFSWMIETQGGGGGGVCLIFGSFLLSEYYGMLKFCSANKILCLSVVK